MITLHVVGVYIWLQITDKMKACASLEVIDHNVGILNPRAYQTNGNFWLKHLLISWNGLEKLFLAQHSQHAIKDGGYNSLLVSEFSS